MPDLLDTTPRFPCIDPQTRRYTPYPCTLCAAPTCVLGHKPTPMRKQVPLGTCPDCGHEIMGTSRSPHVPRSHTGCRVLCTWCDQLFMPPKRGRTLYCSMACCTSARTDRKRRRRAGGGDAVPDMRRR